MNITNPSAPGNAPPVFTGSSTAMSPAEILETFKQSNLQPSSASRAYWPNAVRLRRGRPPCWRSRQRGSLIASPPSAAIGAGSSIDN